MIPSIPPCAISVRILDGYRLEVRFDTGEIGTVDLEPFTYYGGVFDRFKDMDYFRRVTINPDFGVLTWPDEVDIAPEKIYELAIKENDDRKQKDEKNNVLSKRKSFTFIKKVFSKPRKLAKI